MRILRQWLQCPKLKEAEIEPLSDKLDIIADHSSVRERAAADAERATVELKKCEYMADHIGEEYDGVISGVESLASTSSPLSAEAACDPKAVHTTKSANSSFLIIIIVFKILTKSSRQREDAFRNRYKITPIIGSPQI